MRITAGRVVMGLGLAAAAAGVIWLMMPQPVPVETATVTGTLCRHRRRGWQVRASAQRGDVAATLAGERHARQELQRLAATDAAATITVLPPCSTAQRREAEERLGMPRRAGAQQVLLSVPKVQAIR